MRQTFKGHISCQHVSTIDKRLIIYNCLLWLFSFAIQAWRTSITNTVASCVVYLIIINNVNLR